MPMPSCCCACRGCAAGPRCSTTSTGRCSRPARVCTTLLGLLAPRVAARVIFDFGLVHSLGYYTGAVFQVYDPAYGMPLGSGGRYDELLGDFGRPLPAVGFALDVERVHIALTAEERGRV